MTAQVQGPAPPGNRPGVKAAAKQLDAPILTPANLPAYCVLLITKYGRPNRRVYLDLGAARTAVARAHAKGQPGELVLCRLEAVTADLDIDGEVAE